MKLIIEDDEGQKRVVPVVSDEITIGREDGNTVRLPERNVSRRHARLIRDEGFFVIEDLGSSNGVRINGDRIDAPRRIEEGDLIQIGDYDLGIEGRIGAVSAPPQMQEATPTAPVRPVAPLLPAAASGAGGSTAIIRVSDLGRAAARLARLEIPRAERPRLVGVSQTVRGQEFPLERTEVRVGRSRENDIVVDHPSLSRQHARLVLEDDDWKILDSSSANGVRVNGETYAMSAVRPGDLIELGHVKLRFCAPGEKFIAAREVDETTGSAERRFPTMAIGLGAVLIACALGGVFFFKASKPTAADDGEITAEAAVKTGDLLFHEKEFVRAVELYEQAAAKGEIPPNLARATGEARAQRTDQDLDRALAAGDLEKARALLTKCGDDAAYYCGKAREKADQVQNGYAKLHLDKARALKTTKPDGCQGEVRLVLASDPSNSDAQQLLGQCAAPAPAPPVREVKKAPAASQAVRDEKVRALLNAGNALTQSKQFPAATAKYQAALELKPSGPLLGLAYRGLGTAAVYAGDPKAAAKWFKRYLPYVDDAGTREQVTTLIRQYSGE
jgi:pSer/pThr/pTyr-binding forkhead associated (FHA) protein/tetratricopeptide (TPR) repeat protein